MKTMVWMAVAGVVWTCWGCKDENSVKKGKDEPWVVEIKSFERDELKVSDILARIDTVELYTDGKAMASIRDLCFLDSMVYILDASKAVSAFNLRTGRLCKQIRTVGRGHNEYIMPNTIASGGGRVHLMDFSGFYPQWQHGEALVGVVHGDDYGSEARLQEARLGAVLFFYYLK